MAYNVEKLHQMENALISTASLVGEKQENPNVDGVKEGLGLTNESLICLNAAEAIKEGVFKTVVMGTFKNGKSTIINALIGRRILPDAVVPATAIISYIRYGIDEDTVYVYFEDGRIEKLSHEDFFNNYKFTLEDTEECKITGTVKRFAEVDYSIVYSDMPILQNGVQILDTPGLEDKDCATKVTLKAANSANAIIYTGSVPSGAFNVSDKEFFKSNFEGRHLNNVFFLFNKSDFYDEDELQDIRDLVKSQLRDVFRDEKGAFDEKLYRKRVFFISAKNVLEKKTGKHSTRYSERDLQEFKKFEQELEEFLTTDARSIATFNSCFSKLANAYQSAIHAAELNKTALEKGVGEVRNDLAVAEEKLGQMETELYLLSKSFEVAKAKTQNVFETQMNGIVDTINNNWDVEMNRIIQESGFSTSDLMAIAWQAVRYLNNEERRNQAFEEKIEPITKGVRKFVERKVEEASDNIAELIRPIIKGLSDDIKQTELKLDDLYNDIYDVFHVDGVNVKKGKVNIFQLSLATLNTDPNVMIELLAGNEMGWANFIKRTLIEFLVDSLLFGLVGGPVGLALFVLKEWWALKKGRAALATTIATQTKSGLLQNLKNRIDQSSDTISSKITKEYDIEFNRISKDVRAKIAEERKLLNDIKNKLNNAQFDYRIEINRCTYIIDKIWELAYNAYKCVFEKEISKEDFVKLSNQ